MENASLLVLFSIICIFFVFDVVMGFVCPFVVYDLAVLRYAMIANVV